MLKKIVAFGFCVTLFMACGEPPLDPTNPESIRKHYAKLQPPIQMSNDKFVSYVKKDLSTIQQDTMNMSMFLVCSKDYLNTPNSKGSAALSAAVAKGNAVMVKYLLEHGADISVRSDELKGLTPLEDAATRVDTLGIINALIAVQKNKDPELLNIGVSLHLAARYGHVKNVEALIENGANINAKSNESFTPLHEAAREGRKSVVEYLISKEADINITDKNGYNSMDWAEANGIGSPYPEVAKILQQAGSKHTNAWRAAFP
jgi:ankyrin repeat protein